MLHYHAAATTMSSSASSAASTTDVGGGGGDDEAKDRGKETATPKSGTKHTVDAAGKRTFAPSTH